MLCSVVSGGVDFPFAEDGWRASSPPRTSARRSSERVRRRRQRGRGRVRGRGRFAASAAVCSATASASKSHSAQYASSSARSVVARGLGACRARRVERRLECVSVRARFGQLARRVGALGGARRVRRDRHRLRASRPRHASGELSGDSPRSRDTWRAPTISDQILFLCLAASIRYETKEEKRKEERRRGGQLISSAFSAFASRVSFGYFPSKYSFHNS